MKFERISMSCFYEKRFARLTDAEDVETLRRPEVDIESESEAEESNLPLSKLVNKSQKKKKGTPVGWTCKKLSIEMKKKVR
ncbi:hypothetical protein ILUMI_23258 [Ignelater luminosus]|uniref:Uncharacterized protein n=1 Tax=Ignelater luminosus TaxID=2038154 RepID=A0A8K0C953_IGNLU|nr:hypothetical protein ILUMI_23258 [Ignelater luminosus]